MTSAADTADGFAGEGNDESMMRSVADAMTNASRTASDHASKVSKTVSEAGPRVMQSASRAAYTGAYFMAYGLVYAVVFVAKTLPQENAVMKGFRDGGVAAKEAVGTR